MSADIDPTEAIPQVTAEMIAQAAARPPAPPAIVPGARHPQVTPPPGPPDPPPAAPVEPYGDGHAAAGHVAAGRLSALVRIPTVSSWNPQQTDHEAFARHRAELARFYPRVHALQSEQAGRDGLLYRWPGRGRADVLHPFPVVLMAHQDVVPAQHQDWPGDPFSGEIRDGAVHGRGTLDDKGGLVAVLEAVETLLDEGFVPERDVWLFFGADAEAGGRSAQTAVQRLYELGVHPWLVLDQGGGVVNDVFPGVDRRTAMVGVAEKGLVRLNLRTTDAGGHAATPGRQPATARLARAVTRVSRGRYAARINVPTVATLERVAASARGSDGALLRTATRLAASPLRRVAAWLLSRSGPEVAALVRTTVAVTELEGSAGVNVAASSARAHVDVRVVLGETVDRTVARLRRVVRDKKVAIEVMASSEPSEVSPADGQQFALLGAAIGASYPDATVVPYVTLDAADARTFTPISDHVYRFSPFALTRAQRQAVHGVGEHLTVDSLGRGVHFYRVILRKIPG